MLARLTGLVPEMSSAAEKELGRRVRRLRDERGDTLEGLAAKSRGLHWSYISQVERQGKNITLVNLLRIAAALETDPAALVEGLGLGDGDAETSDG